MLEWMRCDAMVEKMGATSKGSETFCQSSEKHNRRVDKSLARYSLRWTRFMSLKLRIGHKLFHNPPDRVRAAAREFPPTHRKKDHRRNLQVKWQRNSSCRRLSSYMFHVLRRFLILMVSTITTRMTSAFSLFLLLKIARQRRKVFHPKFQRRNRQKSAL